MVILRACLWFDRNVSQDSFLHVFALKLAALMTESSVAPVVAVNADMTVVDFLGSVMVQYEELGNPPLGEIPHIGTVIDKCQPIVEVETTETLTLTLIEFSAH